MENIIDKLYSLYLKNPVVCTDTRKITKGCLFFALKGENFNGNNFAQTALQNGASAAVIDEVQYDANQGCFLVKDVLEALQQLALHHRRQLHIPFIAITGSNGKTTTKELTAAVLSTTLSTCCTIGNLNNHIGVPLTLLSVNSNHQVAVIEMGANHLKEIEFLCNLAEPTHGLITNIGKAHLEGFGDLEGVKKGKGEMYNYLKTNKKTIFINPDQPALAALLGNYENFIAYGSKAGYDISGNSNRGSNMLKVTWNNKNSKSIHTIQTQLTGDYNLSNVLAAVCIGDYFKVPAEKICSSIAAYQPGNQRSQVVIKGSNTIILDAYNANPSSMEVALGNFNDNYSGNKLVVIGDMLELGNDSLKEHERIASLIEKLKFKEIILVGPHFGKCADKINCHFFKDATDAKNWIQQKKFKDFSVLIKGSRGLKMETTLEGF